MVTKRKNLFLIVSLLFFGFYACNSFVEKRTEKLQGNWNRIPITNENKIVWSFLKENMLIRTEHDTILDTAQYSLELKQGRYYLDILNLNYDLNGKYIILKCNDEILILQRVEAEYEGAFLRREFVKM